MPTNQEFKQKARDIMVRTKPAAVIVGLVYFLARWIINYCDTQITGLRVSLDYNAYLAGDTASAFSYEWPEVTFLGWSISLALLLVGFLLFFGFTFYCLEISRGKKAGIPTLLDGFSVWAKALGISLISTVIIILSSVFLIVPGVIAFYNYSMAPMLLYDHPEWSAVQCLRMSREMMRGHKRELFRLHLSFIGWIILCIIPAASVYVFPYMTCAQALFYNIISGYSAGNESASAENTLDKGQ